ncbi:MAG TPA: hypothetical protein VFV87_19720 [Pirellulaceae bacterium]|nr:hypothetical protein [Pirellulaceae bacterium]
MQSAVTIAAACPKCQGQSIECRFNYFDRGDLQIHSWEHRCPNCGWRQTQAFRSDVPQAENLDPAACPWCSRKGEAS